MTNTVTELGRYFPPLAIRDFQLKTDFLCLVEIPLVSLPSSQVIHGEHLDPGLEVFDYLTGNQ